MPAVEEHLLREDPGAYPSVEEHPTLRLDRPGYEYRGTRLDDAKDA